MLNGMTVSETSSFLVYVNKAEAEELIKELWLHSGAYHKQSLGSYIEDRMSATRKERSASIQDDIEAVEYASKFVGIKPKGGEA